MKQVDEEDKFQGPFISKILYLNIHSVYKYFGMSPFLNSA